MTALQCLLFVCKLLGWILLAAVGLALLAVLLVLLVPVRYELKLRFRDGELRARARAGWLCRLLRVSCGWIEDCGLLRANIGPKKLAKLHFGNWPEEAEPEEKETEAEAAPPGGKAPKAAQPAAAEEKAAAPLKEESSFAEGAGKKNAAESPCGKKKRASGDTSRDTQQGNDPEEKKRLRKEKTARRREEKAVRKQERTEKRAALKRKAAEVKAFLEDAANRKTIALLKKQLRRLGRHLLPKHFLLEGEIGLGDPARTGQLIGRIYTLYPLYGESIRVQGDYNGEAKNIYLELRGRLRLGVFAGAALRMLANKNFRGWLRHLKSGAAAAEEGADAQQIPA